MRYYPIFLNVRERRCAVVGGGPVALQKVQQLYRACARVRVISPELVPELREMVVAGEIEHCAERYRAEHLDGAFLVVAATDDPATNESVFREAEARGLLCNVVDQPEYCNFIIPAVVSRGDLQIAISTSGISPALARHLRLLLEQHFGPEFEEFLDLLSELRQEVKARFHSSDRRRRILQRIVESDVLELLREGRRQEARARAFSILHQVGEE